MATSESTPAESDKGGSLRDILKEMLIFALAGPAALGILGKLNDKIDFSDPLTRIVVNFRTVTNALWQIAFAAFDLDIDPEVVPSLTITVLLLAPLAAQRLLSPPTRSSESRQILVFSSVMLLGGLVYGLHPLWAVLFSIIFYVFILILKVVLTRIWPRVFELRINRWQMFTIMALPVWIFFMLLSSLLGTSPYMNRESLFLTYTVLFSFPVIAFLLTLAINRGSPGPLYIVLFALGTMTIDWLARVGKPAVETWLTSVGA